MAFYDDVCPKWLLLMPLFLSSSSFLHFPPGILLEKDFLATKLFSSTSTSLLEPSTPLPSPSHYPPSTISHYSVAFPQHICLSALDIYLQKKSLFCTFYTFCKTHNIRIFFDYQYFMVQIQMQFKQNLMPGPSEHKNGNFNQYKYRSV